ncbi:cell envelope biogenesis protein TolA [Bradyrhizobium sp. 18BD]
MPRKLKTFQTSLGFYDLVVAAPSMKAALEAWGAGSNLFHQGFARQTDDSDLVAATMSKPGVVLKRPAGSSGSFAEHSDLPSDLGSEGTGAKREKRRPKPAKKAKPKIGEREARKAAVAFEKEEKRQAAQRRREEAARKKEQKRRDKATAKAQAALDAAEREHADRAESTKSGIEALEKQAQAEEGRWEKERERLRAALRRARE